MAHASRYRPDIDGLRAFAVSAVILYHAFPSVLPGGFVGVDVFFVISGYLISGILLREAKNGGIRFLDFYRRRINRIFPSVAVVLFFCLAFGWISLFPKEFHQLGGDVASGASFSSNFSLLGEAGYFDRGAATKPLLHLWSLAIEEQFYIFWPLLLWGVAKSRTAWTPPLLAVALISFVYCGIEAAQAPVADFYLPLTRFWELAAGAVLAAANPAQEAPATARHAISLFGGCALAAAAGLCSTAGYPGWAAALPVAGTVALLAAGDGAVVNRVLAVRPLRAIGAISYPLYLWHWPLLSFGRILEGQTPAPALRVALIGFAVLLATLTHFAVENPMRHRPFVKRKTAVALAAMLLAGGLGQWIFLRHGLPQRRVVAMNSRFLAATADPPTPAYAVDICGPQQAEAPRPDGCLSDTRELPRFALIGDSKAGALTPEIFMASRPGVRFLYLGNNNAARGLLSTTLLSPQVYPSEYALTRTMPDRVEANPRIKAVVIADAARTLFSVKGDDSLDGLPRSAFGPRALRALDAAVSEVLRSGRRVYLIEDNPTVAHPEDCAGRLTSVETVNRLFALPVYPAACSVSFTHFRETTKPYRALLDIIAARHPGRAIIIDTSNIYCEAAKNVCPSVRDGHVMYKYTDHASPYVANLVDERIIARLRQERSARAENIGRNDDRRDPRPISQRKAARDLARERRLQVH